VPRFTEVEKLDFAPKRPTQPEWLVAHGWWVVGSPNGKKKMIVVTGGSIKHSNPSVSWLCVIKWLENVIRKKLMVFLSVPTDDANEDVLKNSSSMGARLISWIIG